MLKNSFNLYISFILLLSITSCNDNKVKASQAKTVNRVTTVNTKLYTKIKTGSTLNWYASHLGGVGKRNGEILYKEASILVNDKQLINMSVTIDMDKITVKNLSEDDIKDLTKHLKSNDFFNVNSYPTSKFELTKVEAIKGTNNSEVTGNLEILGVSKSITFKANINVSDNEVSIKSESFAIDRSDWGMTYNAEGTAGVPLDYLISNDVGFILAITILKKTKINQELINNIPKLIDSLYTVDQNIQLAHKKAIQNGENKKRKELALQQKTTFERHIPILKEIYKQIGYPTIELVGKKHSNMYFTLVQHSDIDLNFQDDMLKVIKEEVKKGNVNVKNFGFLTDRVGLALKNKQVYGTQVNYNTEIGQAFPKPLIDSINVNKRRQKIGIGPIEVYLNKSSKLHFKMNKTHYDKLGIKEPKLYDIN